MIKILNGSVIIQDYLGHYWNYRGIIITCHIWLALFRRDVDNEDQSHPEGKIEVRISQWQQGYLEAIDSLRIVLHKTSGRDYLNVRQNGAVESAARHNADHPIYLFMRRTPSHGNTSDVWLTVLRRYNNEEAIQIGDDIVYSNNTALFIQFKTSQWRINAERNDHLADYIRSVTLFRGGGLVLDMD